MNPEIRMLALELSPLRDPALFQKYYETQPLWRREKIDALRRLPDKIQSLGAGILLQKALPGSDLNQIRFGENGKPFLSGRDDIFFSISHSEKKVVCAFSDRPVGADIEKRFHFDSDLIHHVYLDSETEYITANFPDPDAAYTDLWTIKESLMKYLGTGLSLDPRDIRIDLAPPVTAYCKSADCAGLSFTLLGGDDYSLAVCSEYGDFPREIRRITP